MIGTHSPSITLKTWLLLCVLRMLTLIYSGQFKELIICTFLADAFAFSSQSYTSNPFSKICLRIFEIMKNNADSGQSYLFLDLDCLRAVLLSKC